MSKKQYPLDQAARVANELLAILSPECERIEISGSVRRQRVSVGDIELLCISKVWGSSALFGGTNLYQLGPALDGLIEDGLLSKRIAADGRLAGYGELNKFLVHEPSGIPVDIFTAPVENWGMAQVVRTGPKAFNIAVMSTFQERGMKGHAYGGVTKRGLTGREEVGCPEEQDVFDLLGWPFVNPPDRDYYVWGRDREAT